MALIDASGTEVYGNAVYAGAEVDGAGDALGASLGCSVPTYTPERSSWTSAPGRARTC